MIELLSPVGDFECLKAAVQNGADSVYFGADIFSARAFAHNFNLDDLKKAIQYAKIRGVKTHLTLNTLIKDDEFEVALNLAKTAYEYGIDAIIVQDLGLATKLIELFPDLPIHGSTQMTVHNLNGALQLQELGFKRVVLARELSINEIDYICKNTNIEIECFAHGALCISYSGQCLFSSMIGGRSGNRGKCAQPCRLPYELFENNKKINSGYLLSTRDLCSLDFIPSFIQSGVKCLKIEGRMKSPEYVATVTRIYKKYIDLALSNEPYVVDKNDRKELMQVFNRGMSSPGHLDNEPNKNLVFKDKPNNMGLLLGKVQNYNKNKGLITVKLKEPVKIGDTISLENETGTYTISELMDNNKNIVETKIGQTVTIGRMKGNISCNDKIYKMSSKELSVLAKESYQKEFRQIPLNCEVTIKKGLPISIHITPSNSLALYKNLNIQYELNEFPIEAKNRPLEKQTVIQQISKTASTPYQFKNINLILDSNVFIPKLSILNELRRKALEQVQDYAISSCSRNYSEDKSIKKISYTTKDDVLSNMRQCVKNDMDLAKIQTPKISVLLNNLNLDFDYSKLSNSIDNIYIPLKFLTNKKYDNILQLLSKKFDTYIYMPTIIKGNYKNLFYTNAENSVKKYDIKGFVISNIGNIKLLNELFTNLDKYFKLVSNYTFNAFNTDTILALKELGISRFTISPELDKKTITSICDYNYLQKELIVYGRIPLINMNYCLLR
jgi:putative protease